MLRDELSAGVLKRLPVREGAECVAALYLILADLDLAGSGARRLATIIRTTVGAECASRRAGIA